MHRYHPGRRLFSVSNVSGDVLVWTKVLYPAEGCVFLVLSPRGAGDCVVDSSHNNHASTCIIFALNFVYSVCFEIHSVCFVCVHVYGPVCTEDDSWTFQPMGALGLLALEPFFPLQWLRKQWPNEISRFLGLYVTLGRCKGLWGPLGHLIPQTLWRIHT